MGNLGWIRLGLLTLTAALSVFGRRTNAHPTPRADLGTVPRNEEGAAVMDGGKHGVIN